MFGWLKGSRRRPGAAPAHNSGAAGASQAQPRIDPESLLLRLEWKTVRVLDGLLQGDYKTLFRGEGMVLAELREYQPHDDVRHIDWNATARMQVPYVREHQEDRDMAAWFLVDLSRSVSFGSGQTSKRMLATEFIGAMARILGRRGNRSGAMIYTGSLTHAERCGELKFLFGGLGLQGLKRFRNDLVHGHILLFQNDGRPHAGQA